MTPMELGFIEPQRLWWLVLVPILLGLYAGLLLWRRKRTRHRPTSPLERVIPHQQAWKRNLAVVFAVLSLASLTVAFAEPKGEVEVPRDRATIVLTMDVSRSMLATDVTPSRLDAAKQAAKDFIGMVPPGFNIALVTFSGYASILVPPTTDRGQVAAAIDSLQVSVSTAIGEGIFTSLDTLAQAPPDPNHPDDPAPGAIVLLSDGATNVGKSSVSAANEAKKQGIPVYTIAFGTASGYVEQNGRREPVAVDKNELARIARLSGGVAFEAASADQLKQVYSSIAQTIGYVKVDQEVTEQYAGYALILAVLAAVAVASLAARWP